MAALQKSGVVSAGASERRNNDRFPIAQDVQYRVLSSKGGPELGSGKTVNISSTGVLFSSEKPITPGRRLEVSIHWPAHLDGKCGLKLVAQGRVVRCQGKLVAVEIEKYEFRTRGSRGLATRVAS